MALSGKTAIITGGARGIGFATAEELLKSGVEKVLILDVGQSLDPARENTLKLINAQASIFYSQCDITDKSALEGIFRKNDLGRLDILVNCAGVLCEHDVARAVAVNLTGLIDCTMLAFDVMGKHKSGSGGAVVNIASIAGFEPMDLCAVYSATKSGVIGFTRAMGSKDVFEHTGIKVVAICPGGTDTDMVMSKGECAIKVTFPWLEAKQIALLEQIPLQKPSAVGKAVVQAVLTAQPGSIWISNEDKVTPMHYGENTFF
ncbi:alcohol dehydrogenase-like [Uranotaenia lowii]|uniref:alcohol dehydrogenase-like n=1 Tax=Uranotaenia lowii TaxID=190385 RepID=UPI002478ACB2|nr:alcohol dehydrogenase-like [Uranotaenia lowii]